MGYAALLYEDWVMRGLQHMSDANQPPSQPLQAAFFHVLKAHFHDAMR